MADTVLSYKARRRWSLVILLIGLPVYIVAAISLIAWLPDLPGWITFFVYVILGFAWMVPLKFVFLGIGQADPDAQDLSDNAR
jgi:predicted MFS family arabinose efflux permease